MSEITLLVEMIKAHTEEDREKFREINVGIADIKATLDRVLAERSFAKGFSKAVAAIVSLIAATVGGAAAAVVTWALRASH